MPNPFFTFKKFTVCHDRCAMKVGTDGVLLGAWTDLGKAGRILDIGTGTGLIALMLAQRSTNALLTAIDLDTEAVSQAKENIAASPWGNRVEVLLQDICTYNPPFRFDLIVSNPPFFVNSLKCPDNQRNTARHTDTLDARHLIGKAAELLAPEGQFSLILPAEQTEEMIHLAHEAGLYLSRHTAVVTRPGLPPKRSLMEYRKIKTTCHSDELLIELERHVYSEAYQALTKDFYLKF